MPNLTPCRHTFSPETLERWRLWNFAHATKIAVVAASIACGGFAVWTSNEAPAHPAGDAQRVAPGVPRLGPGQLILSEPIIRTPDVILTERGRALGLRDAVSVPEPPTWTFVAAGLFFLAVAVMAFRAPRNRSLAAVQGGVFGLGICGLFWMLMARLFL